MDEIKKKQEQRLLSKRNFWVITTNSTAAFVLAFLFVFYVNHFTTLLTAGMFDYDVSFNYYVIFYHIEPYQWTHDSVKLMYSAGPILILLVGLIALIGFYSMVEEVARAYVEAGSQVIITNTFGASQFMLKRHGLEQKVAEINRAGAEISKRAAGAQARVFGSIGPSGLMLMMGEVTPGIATAVASARGRKLLVPINQPHFEIVGIEWKALTKQISAAIEVIRQVLE